MVQKKACQEILYLSPQDGRILCNITALCQSQNLCSELRGSTAVKVHWNDSLCMNFSPAGPNIYTYVIAVALGLFWQGVDISLKYREEAQILVIISLLSLLGIPLHVGRFLSHSDINTVNNLQIIRHKGTHVGRRCRWEDAWWFPDAKGREASNNHVQTMNT